MVGENMRGKKKTIYIAVIGGHRCSEQIREIAEQVGRKVAEMGAVLVCGGLTGVMEAACKGAKSAKGITVGILPGESREEANPYVDFPILTGIGYMRNALVVKNAQAVIAIDGSVGTLSEIAFALQMNKPVIGIKTWDIEGVVQVKDAEEAIKEVKRVLFDA
ncbi:MAG: TIGR00725 family protein [Candidatus Omnitrophota bacterium]|nr:MAG: TIGR00725 family protein [Candidatus Omnitrophota bacterium]